MPDRHDTALPSGGQTLARRVMAMCLLVVLAVMQPVFTFAMAADAAASGAAGMTSQEAPQKAPMSHCCPACNEGDADSQAVDHCKAACCMAIVADLPMLAGAPLHGSKVLDVPQLASARLWSDHPPPILIV
jgi:hypothetical protein